jgi:hypothetical protein
MVRKEKELLLKAIEKNEIIKYLQGRDGYRVEMEPWTPAHLLTDWTKIIPWGIYEVYKENPELGLDKMIEDAILEMMDGEPFDIYVALYLVYIQYKSISWSRICFN